MIKTQVQIPDRLYRQAKRVAAEQETSFAEVVRRGLEYVTATHGPGRTPAEAWSLPKPADMGRAEAREKEWAALSH